MALSDTSKKYMEILFLIGRVLYGGYFTYMGIQHFTKNQALAGYAGSKGVPYARQAVYLAGALIFLGGLGVLLGVYTRWAVLALVLFLVPVTFMMHAFWKVSDPNGKMMDMVQFNKNMALLGAALMLLQIPEPWTYSLL